MYRNYMADMSMYTVNNIGAIVGGAEVVEVKKRFSDLLIVRKEETRTAEEIIEDFKTRLNGEHNESI